MNIDIQGLDVIGFKGKLHSKVSKNSLYRKSSKIMKDSFVSTLPRPPITISNYHRIDGYLSRGGKLNENQVLELKQHGFKHVICFRTNHKLGHVGKFFSPEEAKWVENAGMQFHWLPFHSKNKPPQNYINDFFRITDNARQNNERVFIHCRRGADRTGLFSAIYRIKNQNVKLSEVIREMFRYGHNANKHSHIIPYVIEFAEKFKNLK